MPTSISNALKHYGLAMLTLVAFVVAQPLFDLLGQQAGYFAAQKAQWPDVLLFVVFLALFCPLVLTLVTVLAYALHRKLGWGVHLFFVMGLLFLGGLRLVKLSGVLAAAPDGASFLVAMVLAGGVSFLYATKTKVAEFVFFLAPSMLIFSVLFLFFSNTTELIFPDSAVKEGTKLNTVTNVSDEQLKNMPNMVMVIWDELPLLSLLDEKGDLDRVRYPHIADFADTAYWFENAYTVGGSTLQAVPAILSGQNPSGGSVHTNLERELNLFTLLQSTHIQKNVIEKYTTLCPKAVCKPKKKKHVKDFVRSLDDLTVVYLHLIAPPQWAKTLPDTSGNWAGFSKDGKPAESKPSPATPEAKKASTESKPKPKRKKRDTLRIDGLTTRPGKKAVPRHKWGLFEKFINRIEAPTDNKPALHFMHIVFPHVPYSHMPSGKYYRMGPYKYFTTWQNQREMFFDFQRHLLQVGAVDTLMGMLVEKLQSEGMYDNTLIVIVADHGASWSKVGGERRMLFEDNASTYAQDFVRVPMLIKLPHQQEHQRISQKVKTTDVLPSIATVLGLSLDKTAVAGKSLFTAEQKPAQREQFESLVVVDNLGEQFLRVPASTRFKTQSFQNKLAWFGTGDTKNIFTGSISDATGRRQDFCHNVSGRQVSDYKINGTSSTHWAQLHNQEAYKEVDLQSTFIPALIEGAIYADNSDSPSVLPTAPLIAVNDVIWNCYPYLVEFKGALTFGGMVPEEAFKQGNNTVRLFEFQPHSTTTLIEIPVRSVLKKNQ